MKRDDIPQRGAVSTRRLLSGYWDDSLRVEEMKFRASLTCFVCFALLLCCIGPHYGVQAQTNWTKYPGNPVITHGPDLAWDWFVMHPSVLEEPTGYKMWFTAQTFTGVGDLQMRIGLATGFDQVTWTKNPSPVMDIGLPGSWEEIGALVPRVIADVVGYKMWYTGWDASDLMQIGYATSPDGITWTRHPGNPVLTPGGPAEWDASGTAAASVVFLGGEYHAWYTGNDASDYTRIGYANSTDGIIWNKYAGNPVLDLGAPGEWDAESVLIPWVLFDGMKYEMWYMGMDASTNFAIGYATSMDGLVWTKHPDNPVLSPGPPGSWDDGVTQAPCVLYTPTGYDMWYNGASGMDTGIGYANSTFPIEHAPILEGGEVSPSSGPRNARFTYNVTYSDEDDDPAAYVRVWINKSGVPFGSSPYDLKFDSWKGAPGDWVAGASYALPVNLYSEGSDYAFAFSASDGKDTVFLPERAGPDVTALHGVEKIAWMSDRSGNMDIWVMDVDGSNPVQLTTDPAEDWFPDWSPGAERIVFASWRAGNSDIWVMDADGSNQTQLTTNASGDFNPVWSPDGTRIAINSRRDGPDSDIWVMDADGSNLVQLTTNVSDDRHASWSPDGSKIVFSTDRTTPNDNDIWVMDADGSNKTEILSYPNYDLGPTWSPDGNRIAWSTRMTGEHDIWVMTPDGSNQTQLTTHPEEDASASWSPDGSRIAYYSALFGNGEIFVMDADGSNQTQLTVDAATDTWPDFALIPSEEPPLPPTLRQAVLVGASLENVELTWNASADDGQPGGTVKYEIWRTTDYAGPYSYLDEVVADGSQSYTYVDSGAGHGDPSNYFYRVRSVNEMAKWNVTNETAGKFVRQLSAGVNFISIPLMQVDENLETVLQTLTFDRAWFYDPAGKEWRYYARQRPCKTDLDRIDHSMGLWVNVTVGSALTVAGMVPASTTIQLRSGWNLVGFPSFNLTYTVADLKAGTGATRVEGFYAPGLPHCLRVFEDFDVLQAGYAYWVRVEVDIVWTVPLA